MRQAHPLGPSELQFPRGNAEAGETPVIVPTDKATEGAPDLEVGLSQGAGLERGRDGPAGAENLGPSGVRSKHFESPMRNPAAADGTDESRRLDHPFAEE